MSELSVLTYNMHKGFSGDGRRTFVLPRMREALAGSAADVVFLQEAQGEHRHHAASVEQWPQASQFEFIADSLWSHHAYGKNALYDHGHHGNAILSRYPLLDWENVDVSPYPFAASRSLLHGRIEIPEAGRCVHLVCIHFGFIAVERRPQFGEARQDPLFHGVDPPLVEQRHRRCRQRRGVGAGVDGVCRRRAAAAVVGAELRHGLRAQTPRIDNFPV